MPAASKSRFAKIARITSKIAGAFVGFVLLLGLVWVVINSFDVPLSDQAKALLTPPPNPYPAENNLYLAMAGMEGPADRPITQMGKERIDAYNQALDSMLLNPDLALNANSKWDAAKLKPTGKLELGPQRTSSIWTTAKSHHQDIAAFLSANQELYQRYLSLHHLHSYFETARPSYIAPVISVPQQLRVLFLGSVANRVHTGTPQQQREALTDLQRDLQTWRTVLKGDGTLIGKMLAAAWLHGDLILLADLIQDPSYDLKPLDDVLDPTLSPFDPKDYRIGNAFLAEWRGVATLYRTISAANEYTVSAALPSWRKRMENAFEAHFFKINATENMSAPQAAHWAALMDSEASQFLQNREVSRQWLEENEPHFSLNSFYNPVGKILVRVAMSQNDSYPLRVYDVAAYQRLVYLAYQLKHQHVNTADVPAFLKSHPDWSTHPVDRKLFGWNPETAELAVNTLGEHPKDQRFSVTLR
jgi:hypothetical protein